MNTTINATVTAPARASFTRLCGTPFVKGLVKEAKRVGYAVEVMQMTDTGKSQIYGYKVTDGSNGDALVFKAILVQRGMWGTTFSTIYWQDPV